MYIYIYVHVYIYIYIYICMYSCLGVIVPARREHPLAAAII